MVVIQIAQHLHILVRQADFFFGFAQSRMFETGVPGFTFTPGKGDLSTMKIAFEFRPADL